MAFLSAQNMDYSSSPLPINVSMIVFNRMVLNKKNRLQDMFILIFSQDGQLYALADHFLQLSNQRTFKQCNISAEDKWSYIIPYKKSYILAHNGSELVLIHY